MNDLLSFNSSQSDGQIQKHPFTFNTKVKSKNIALNLNLSFVISWNTLIIHKMMTKSTTKMYSNMIPYKKFVVVIHCNFALFFLAAIHETMTLEHVQRNKKHKKYDGLLIVKIVILFICVLLSVNWQCYD
jgi:hypothetical protein